MSIRRSFIIVAIATGTLAAPALAQSARDDNPDIRRAKLKFALGKKKPVANTPRLPYNPLKLPYVPLPRVKPVKFGGTGPNRPTPPPGSRLFKANKRGEVTIELARLQRERDAAAARELRPNTKSTWSAAQIATARKRCDLVLATTNIDADRLDPIGGPEGCGIAAPLLIRSFGAVKIHPPAKLNCNMALATYKWLVDKVQPIARRKYGIAVTSIRNLSSYSCRSRRGSGTSRISEHSFGNALDIANFGFANRAHVSVLNDWSTAGAIFGIGKDANFLFDSHKAACESFATVLSPRYNKAHANHFHMDLGRGGRYKICK